MAAPKPVRAKAHRAMRNEKLKLFTGNANPALATEIAECLGLELGVAPVRTFADGEIYLQIKEDRKSTRLNSSH